MQNTDQNKMLALAIQLASEFHLTQFDQGGHPYILHPIQVMHNLHSNDPELRQIAILHDVVEDCIRKVLLKYYKDMDNVNTHVDGLIRLLTQEEKVNLVLKAFTDWGFSFRVTEALRLMTKLSTDKGESGYFAYIERMFNNVDAMRVKIADLRHNSDILRLKGIDEKDFMRSRKYQIAFARLNARLLELCPSHCIM